MFNVNFIFLQIKLGFLTGDESKAMIDAHLAAAYVIGEPFSKMNEGTKFNFEHSDLTERVTGHLQTVNQKRRSSS